MPMSHFRPITRDVDFLLPPSVQDWLPEGHLARYVVEVVEGIDLSALERAYAGRGSLPYHPALLLSLLIYGYATSCYSSRQIERATDDALAFRFITANPHPDHDTLSTFRRRFAQEFEDTFVPVLPVARENPLSRFGTVSLDGTKIHANASRHSALSYGHAEAMEAKLAARAAKEANGRKPGGKPPKAPTPGPRPNVRSTSLTKSPASCPSPGVPSSSATTPKG
jgi:transposase